ncbi:MAG: alpha/beta fold hydrolase [Proteobacteria bacterium]|nr:alpha/beta fold hydrolase [Pseudomonadota bacterium]
MAHFILVHGAYHGGWCWERLIPLLNAAGHTAAAPDLPGHGADPGGLAAQRMEAYVECIARLIDTTPAPAIVVGHSMAGAIVANVCETRPDRILRAVFLAAYIPADGQSISDLAKTDKGSRVRVEMTEREGLKAVALASENLGEAFYNDASAVDLSFAAAGAGPQSAAPFRAKAVLSEANFGRAKKSAILTLNDQAISPELQRRMAIAAGCDPILEIASGHSPFLTAPAELAHLFVQSAARKPL